MRSMKLLNCSLLKYKFPNIKATSTKIDFQSKIITVKKMLVIHLKFQSILQKKLKINNVLILKTVIQ